MWNPKGNRVGGGFQEVQQHRKKKEDQGHNRLQNSEDQTCRGFTRGKRRRTRISLEGDDTRNKDPETVNLSQNRRKSGPQFIPKNLLPSCCFPVHEILLSPMLGRLSFGECIGKRPHDISAKKKREEERERSLHPIPERNIFIGFFGTHLSLVHPLLVFLYCDEWFGERIFWKEEEMTRGSGGRLFLIGGNALSLGLIDGLPLAG